MVIFQSVYLYTGNLSKTLLDFSKYLAVQIYITPFRDPWKFARRQPLSINRKPIDTLGDP